jgi:anti-sigma B factor antagonist
MAEDLLCVALTHLDGLAVLTARGEIDANSVTTLHAALNSLDMHTTIELNMAEVRFMDSSGINAILAHALRMNEGGGSIQISHPSTAVRRIVEITGLETVLFDGQTNNALALQPPQNNGNESPSVEASHRSDSDDSVDEEVA